MNNFRIGDRVRASMDAARVTPRFQGKEGTVITPGNTRTLVLFDFAKNGGRDDGAYTIDTETIELVDVEPTEQEIADLFRVKPPCPTCGCLCSGRP